MSRQMSAALLKRYLADGGDLETLAHLNTAGVWDGGATLNPTIALPLWPRHDESLEAWQKRVGRIIIAGSASAFYGKGLEHFAAGGISFTSDTMKVALVTNGYTPNLSTHETITDLGANIVGTSQTLTTKTNTLGVMNADPATWSGGAAPPSSATPITYIVIYKDTGTAGTSWLMGVIDTATNLPLTPNGGSVSVTWSTGANKLAKL